MISFVISEAVSPLDLEQVRDLRRSVLCGELNWPRESVEDPADSGAILLLASLGAKPVGSLRLIQREGLFHIECVAVLERFRGQGIGRALMRAAETRAQAKTYIYSVGPHQAFFEALLYKPTSDASLLEKCPAD